MIGRILANRYEILQQLGGGGMAIVYKGRDTLLNRLVTIKVLRPEYTSDAEFVARFRREAQAVARLSHPNIVSIYDVGREENIQFLVMEYVEGENLKTVIRRLGLLPAGDAVAIAVQIAEALEHAHENHIVHRDVKPHNILITPLGRAKLTDFGIAMEAQTGTVVNSGTVMGSVHYLSPEQARGEVAGPPSDIYSLGVVLYEMLSGTVPFTAETPVGVAMKHIQENPLPVTAANATVPPGPAAVTAKAMQKVPAHRYARAGDMALDLTASCQEQPLDETVIIRKKIGGWTPRQRRMVKSAALVALLLVVAGLVAWAGNSLSHYLNVPVVRVPDVTGKTYAEASTIMTAAGLHTNQVMGVNPSIPKGQVISQDPPAGAEVKQDRVVTLTVSQGPQMVQVPALTGLTVPDAKAVLDGVGLQTVEQIQNSATVPKGRLINQTPQAGSLIPAGDKITLVISGGPPQPVAVPDLTGLTMGQAAQKLTSLNLDLDQANVAYVVSTQYLSGQVVSQYPQAGAGVTTGTPVQLTLSTGPGPAPRDADVTNVRIPADGNSHQLKIVVRDVRGLTEAYSATEPSGSVVNRPVRYYGPAVISVYIDGTLAWQQGFPG